MAATARESLKDLVAALLGISTFAPPSQPGPDLDDAFSRSRFSLGGQLEPIPQVRLRWYPPDIERAQRAAQSGDMTMVGQLAESMKIDGALRGMLDARTSVVNFPRRFYGAADIVETLMSKKNSDRNIYEEMIPRTEAQLMVGDGVQCGIAVGTVVPVQGRDFPVLVRRYPQNLFFLPSYNQWYYRSIAGNLPITPGVPQDDGTMWVLHIPGGRLSPWNNGLWNTTGRSYVNKTQSIFARQSYEMKHAHPARVGTAPIGASQEERKGFIRALVAWALNAAFAMPVGWDIKLIESNGRGIEIYEKSIQTANEEMATALCGSAVMLQGTVGFANMDPFKVVNKNLLRATAQAWDHTENTQILPAFVAQRWGIEALADATTVETDVEEPADRKIEADTMVSFGNAVKAVVEAINAAQVALGTTEPVALDVGELLARFGLPTRPTTVQPAAPEAPGAPQPGSGPSGLAA